MRILILFKLTFLITTTSVHSQVIQNWRGPERNGIYHETGLLQEWPAGGPLMEWAFEQLGDGFTSPVIHEKKVFITGMEERTGYLYVLLTDGTLERKFPYGEEYYQSYPGTRSTPSITGNRAYMVTGHGVLVCMDHTSGNILWQRDLFNDFDGSNIRWGFTENLLISGDTIFCTPGGPKFNITALNRYNGEVIWVSPGTGGLSSYCSPLLINHNGRRILVTMMQSNIAGVDATSGETLWTHPHANFRNIHPNTPIYHEGQIYALSGYGMGGVKLRLNRTGDEVTEVWFNDDLDTQLGGTVLVDGFIYGAGDRNRFWFCVDWETGETVYRSRDIDKGTVIWADGRLYCYTERGELAIMEPTPEGFIIRGQTSVKLGSAQHWAHLVIDNGILYVRHGNALMAYNISK